MKFSVWDLGWGYGWGQDEVKNFREAEVKCREMKSRTPVVNS